jgi:hypothetical protein
VFGAWLVHQLCQTSSCASSLGDPSSLAAGCRFGRGVALCVWRVMLMSRESWPMGLCIRGRQVLFLLCFFLNKMTRSSPTFVQKKSCSSSPARHTNE